MTIKVSRCFKGSLHSGERHSFINICYITFIMQIMEAHYWHWDCVERPDCSLCSRYCKIHWLWFKSCPVKKKNKHRDEGNYWLSLFCLSVWKLKYLQCSSSNIYISINIFYSWQTANQLPKPGSPSAASFTHRGRHWSLISNCLLTHVLII